MPVKRTRLGMLPPFLVFMLLGMSLAWHWNDRLLNSQMFRQVHTAQNAEMYNLVGWNPLRAYYRFAHRPGINVLELPLYQSLNAGLSRIVALTIDQSGKLINVVCGLLFAFGILVLQRRLLPRGKPSSINVRSTGAGHERLSLNALRHAPSRTMEGDLQALALVFSVPLLFGLSQWVLADLLSSTLAVWALILFHDAGRNSAKISWSLLRKLVGFLAVLFFSFAIKPTVLIATAPFYALLLWNGKSFEFKSWPRLVCAAIAVLGGLTWFWYGQRLNQRLGGQFKISDSGYYLGSYAFSLPWLGKLAARLILYVTGPGTLLAVGWSFAQEPATRRALKRPVALACLASAGFYIFVFLNLNVRHNYYQLPLLIPVSIWLLSVARQSARTIYHWPIVLSIALVLNIAVSEYQLLRVDRDLNSTIELLRGEIASGIDRPELTVITSIDAAGPVFAYYLGRYVSDLSVEGAANARPDGRWFAACDQASGDACRQRVIVMASACAVRGRLIGRYWTCVPTDRP